MHKTNGLWSHLGDPNIAGIQHDLTKPLLLRLRDRKGSCGQTFRMPCQRKPRASHPGWGFYTHAHSSDRHDVNRFNMDGCVVARLRLTVAGRSTWRDLEFGDEFYGIVATLPRGRGFLAGFTMGEGMCASLDGTIYPTFEDAEHAARDESRAACDRAIEDRANEAARDEAEALAEG